MKERQILLLLQRFKGPSDPGSIAGQFGVCVRKSGVSAR